MNTNSKFLKIPYQKNRVNELSFVRRLCAKYLESLSKILKQNYLQKYFLSFFCSLIFKFLIALNKIYSSMK